MENSTIDVNSDDVCDTNLTFYYYKLNFKIAFVRYICFEMFAKLYYSDESRNIH